MITHNNFSDVPAIDLQLYILFEVLEINFIMLICISSCEYIAPKWCTHIRVTKFGQTDYFINILTHAKIGDRPARRIFHLHVNIHKLLPGL